jgi:hypothetical protein
MPTISLTLSDKALGELVDALCEFYGYQAEIDGQPNPEARAHFARRMLLNWMKEHVLRYRRRMAEIAASGEDPEIT